MGKPRIEMIGKTFGQLTVLEPAESVGGEAAWRCRCTCGGEAVVTGRNLRRGNTRSCGCLRSTAKLAAGDPGAELRSAHPDELAAFLGMHAQCADPDAPGYALCGGRGAVVCARWTGADGFAHFLEDLGPRPAGQVLDRIDGDGDFAPSNCRWAEERTPPPPADRWIARGRWTMTAEQWVHAERCAPPRRIVGRLVDLTGLSFGKLTVLRQAENVGRRTAWLCRCTCGAELVVKGEMLSSGRAWSCRACRSAGTDWPPALLAKAKLALYDAVDRCTNPRSCMYTHYGARGIGVCAEWRAEDGFEQFLKDVGLPAHTRLSLDRIDVDGDYRPGNVRWVNRTVQANNTTRNQLLEHAGRTQTVAQWSAELGIPKVVIFARLRRGWTAEQALTGTPPVHRRRSSAKVAPEDAPIARVEDFPRVEDLRGRRFGKLVVRDLVDLPGNTRWLCACDCGRLTLAYAGNLKSGLTTSCGCVKRAKMAAVGRANRGRRTPGGQLRADHPELLSIYKSMHARCELTSERAFPNFGGRGIRVCPEWSGPDGFTRFCADVGDPPEGMVLGRVDLDGDFSPGNCRWVPRFAQRAPRRDAAELEYAGVRMPLTEWAELFGVGLGKLRQALHRGTPPGLALLPTTRGLSEAARAEAVRGEAMVRRLVTAGRLDAAAGEAWLAARGQVEAPRRRTRLEDLTGRVYGQLTVVGRVHTGSRNTVWRCTCTCGASVDVQAYRLTHGEVDACPACRQRGGGLDERG